MVLAVAGVSCLFAIRANTTKASADEGPSWERINRTASQVKNGDEKPIRDLADQVFKHHGIDSAVMLPLASMKDRLVAREIDYQNGKGGINEEQVAGAVNQLADRFNGPSYAHTTGSEVKKLRLRMLTLYPSLIGRGPSSSRDDSRPHFEARMGPLEAFHVTATMLHQKVFNPEFQLSQEEAQDSSLQSRTGDGAVRAKDNAHGERTREMLDLIQQQGATMKAGDLIEQCGHTLDLLGVPK